MFKETIKNLDKASLANKIVGTGLALYALKFLKKGFKYEGAAKALEGVDEAYADYKETERNRY